MMKFEDFLKGRTEPRVHPDNPENVTIKYFKMLHRAFDGYDAVGQIWYGKPLKPDGGFIVAKDNQYKVVDSYSTKEFLHKDKKTYKTPEDAVKAFFKVKTVKIQGTMLTDKTDTHRQFFRVQKTGKLD